MQTSQKIFGLLRTLFSPRISRDPRRFYVTEFPILFTDAMGMKFSLPFRLFAAYEVCGPLNLGCRCGGLFVIAALCRIRQTSLPP